jgi:hypothetical protein
MPTTYEPIETTTLGSAAASYTFSGISSAYTDLVLIANATAASIDNLVIQFNGDNVSNYSWTTLGGNGTAASSNRGTSTNLPYVQYESGVNTTPNFVQINIMNYSNATTFKTAICHGSHDYNGSGGVDATVVLWRSTAAITSVKILTRGAVNLATGSKFTLYGILKA